MDGKLAYEFIGFGAIGGQFACEFIVFQTQTVGFAVMDGNLPYEFIGCGALDGQLTYEFTWVWGHGWPYSL